MKMDFCVNFQFFVHMARQFGKFQLLKKIATGGMAEIHIAKQRGMEGFEKIVVIKVILPHLATNQDLVNMFLDEARIAARLTHSNIVQIYDLGRAGGTFFIAMEYVQGENLRTIAKSARKQGNPLPLEHTVKIISQACEGLHYAHNKADTNGVPLHIVHRDISPQNILVSFEGVVKLVDFGIAKAATQYAETKAGILKGKYSYMSPEQCKGKHIDHRSDIFSLGIVLWELATGVRLYKKSSELMILKEITEGKVTPPREINQKVPAELEAIILKALEKHPDNRFQDGLQMHMALEEFMKTRGLTSSTVHLSAFMRELFKEKLDGLRKIEEVQAAGDSLESFLFDDINLESEMYVPGTGVTPSQASPISTPSQPLYPKPTTGVSRISPAPSPPTSGRTRNLLLGALLVVLLGVLGTLGYLIYSRMKTPEPTPKDAGIPVAVGKGTIHVTSTPTGAKVLVDGNDKGNTPCDVKDLDLGTFYTLQVETPDHRPWTTQFKLEDSKEVRRFHARLEAKTAGAGMGWVELTTDPPGAIVTLNGKPVTGTTPLVIPKVAANRTHMLRASLEGRQDWAKTFQLQPNQHLKLEGELPEKKAPDAKQKIAVYSLRSKPRGAKFFLDGNPVSTKRLKLTPGGSYLLTARLAGYKEYSERLQPSPGEKKTIQARLEKKTTSGSRSGNAQLSVDSTPWAVVYLDGVHIGTTPVAGHEITPGSHTIRLVNNQIHSSKTVKITAKSGETIRRAVEFQKGYLQVRAKPWAHVRVHGKKIGTTPFEPKELYEGTYTVVLENPTLGRTVERQVVIKPGETAVLTADFLE
jgi:serine/threonine protein kinase